MRVSHCRRFKIQFEIPPSVWATSPIICITGVCTGIGKTVLTGLLAAELLSHQSVVTQKWIQSGDLHSPDIQMHDEISGHCLHEKWTTDRQVYSFNDSVSPHLAAQLGGQSILPAGLISATRRLVSSFDVVLVETSGGIMVPISEDMLVGDVVKQMAIPTIVVVPNRLGCINHALLTFHYLTPNPIIGFFMNEIHSTTVSPMHTDNPKIISKYSGQRHLGNFGVA
jgi:dethiobiotin synthetase